MAIKEQKRLSRVPEPAAGTMTSANNNSGAAFSNVFSTLPMTEPNLCRQIIAPQSFLTIKFVVTDDKQKELRWCMRLHHKGHIMFAVYRRPLVHETVFTNRVSQFKVSSTTSASTPNDDHDKSGTSLQSRPVEQRPPPSPLSASSTSKGGDKAEDRIEVAATSEPREDDPDVRVGNVVSVYEEVEEDVECFEDMEADLEIVEKPKKVSESKDFFRGSLECEKGFMYSVVLENTATLFPSRIVEYNIRLTAPANAASGGRDGDDHNEDHDNENEDDNEDSDEIRWAKMEDLLRFVNEIMSADSSKTSRDKSPKSDPKPEEAKKS